MQIEQRPLAEIKPYEKNPRINDAAVDAVAESLRQFGFRQPIVVDADGVIVCGHTRYRAAQKLGLIEVPVHVAKVDPQSMIHLTEKPVELAVRAMQYSSRVGENVLDLFGGSGSTLIAAEQTGRRAFLMEIDPPYCDVIVQRWEKFTGRKAERVSGRSNAPQADGVLVEHE